MAGRFTSRLAIFSLSLFAAPSFSFNLPPSIVPPSFENTAIIRTVELGGSTVHVTTSYTLKSLEDGSTTYFIALPEDENEKTSWIDAKVKGKAQQLEVKGYFVEQNVALYSVDLPKALSKDGTTTIIVNTIQSHASKPWPPTSPQSGNQSLLFEAVPYVLSPYRSQTQRTKFRVSSPEVHSYTIPEGLNKYAESIPATKSGATITYGPFVAVPPSANTDFLKAQPHKIKVHYAYDSPVLTAVTYHRSAEISHWGANLNIHDQIVLRNDGPTLKGHFSRLTHQEQKFHGRPAPHIANELVVHLPASARNPYFIDTVGNVSTSHFRPVPSMPRGSPPKYSILEFKPRYPLLGGWNYSFTLGWDLPLGDWASYDKSSGTYIVGIPFYTPIPGAVVDDGEVKVILPEGATDITIHPPFTPDSISQDTHVTYLDTIGRPAITFKKQNLTPKHTGLIYLSYRVPNASHLRKPVAVAAAALALFSFLIVARRVDLSIHTKTKTA